MSYVKLVTSELKCHNNYPFSKIVPNYQHEINYDNVTDFHCINFRIIGLKCLSLTVIHLQYILCRYSFTKPMDT